MVLIERIQANFHDSIKLKDEVAKTLSPTINDAGQVMVKCLNSGGKILSCGNGGSASDACHFTAEIVNRFQMERDGLHAVSLTSDMATLTAIANDYDYQSIFSRQIKALGRKGDILLAISTSGNSQNVVHAIHKAHECGIQVIALTGKGGGLMAGVLEATDIEIRVPSEVTPRIQEVHILIIHCLCELIDLSLFKKNEEMV
ncbi:MAG: phosphoheptose isomerase [Gammaproteobacteria bacterium]|nr:phosphoheptose isomerase [Gammaproteobacteria bacterium]